MADVVWWLWKIVEGEEKQVGVLCTYTHTSHTQLPFFINTGRYKNWEKGFDHLYNTSKNTPTDDRGRQPISYRNFLLMSTKRTARDRIPSIYTQVGKKIHDDLSIVVALSLVGGDKRERRFEIDIGPVQS